MPPRRIPTGSNASSTPSQTDPPALYDPKDTQDSQYEYSYEKLAKGTQVSEEVLRRETDLRYWTDAIDMEANPDKIKLSSYAGCALMELRTTSLQGNEFACAFVKDFQE